MYHLTEYVMNKIKISYSVTGEKISSNVCWVEKDSPKMQIVTDIELATLDFKVTVEVLETRTFRMVG